MKNIFRLLFLFTVLLLLFFSCSSVPSGKDRTPAWVSSPPADTADSAFFVGAGTDPSGNLSAAEQGAVASLIGEVTRYMGVRITSDITVEARATLDDFQQMVTERIQQQSGAQVSDFRVVEKWTAREGSAVTVYMLGQYNRRSLEAEKARLEAIFREQQEASSRLETLGNEFEQKGEYYKAAVAFCEAAAAAVTSGAENPGIRFDRNINKAKAAVSRINFFVLNNNLSGYMGSPLDEPFRLKVAAAANAAGFDGIPVQIAYKEIRSGGRPSVQTQVVQTGKDGTLSFNLPVPRYVGKEQVTMTLDFRAALEPLYSLPRQYQESVDSLRITVTSKRAVFDYTIMSMASTVPTGLLVFDLDRSGNPVQRADTLAGIQEILTGSNFNLQALPQDAALMALPEAEIIKRLSGQYRGSLNRVVFGTAQISGFEESGGNFIVRVEGTVKVFDLETGRVLLTDSKIRTSRGTNANSAISAAFKGLGNTLGETLVNSLP